MNHTRLLVCALGMLSGLWLFPPVSLAAESLDEIYAIADRKEFDTALKRLNQFLAEHPQDAQGRFLKGLILTETKQRDQAITIFQQLSKDFPELPEPYNNLAVLYAEQGNFEKAQEALSLAVKAHPNYATAHENLGDIHAKMASQSYARALKLNQGNTALAGKLNKVKTLFTEGAETARAPQAPVQSAKSPTPPAAKTPPSRSEPPHPAAPPVSEGVVASKAPAVPVKAEAVPVKAEAVPVKAEAVPEAAPVKPEVVSAPKVTPDPAEPMKKPEPPAMAEAPKESGAVQPAEEKTTGKADPESQNHVKQAVLDWAAAWSAKNIDGYVDAYSANFQPIGKNIKTREAWEKNRREVIGKAGAIHIDVSDLQITMLNDNRAQATFQQNYTAKNYRDRVKKTLSLEHEPQGWKIVREYAIE
ncbi:MAG: tetratricopeptide repeat protein [Magnetococcales bacterium]|nr:tetratricopeptide repeat protein [Magnetococcales bacterium]